MDTRKIALFLSGKIPPNYEKYNRLWFMEYLEVIFWINLEKIDFYWKQASWYEEEFYFLVIDLLYKKSLEDENQKIKFQNLIEKLNLPDELVWTRLNRTLLKDLWDKLKNETNSQTKWKMLEEFLEKLFNTSIGLKVIDKNLNNWDEELDLILKNNGESTFYHNLNSPLILLEAKNWKDKVQTKVTRDFSTKVHLHRNLTRIWLFVSVNWYTGEVDELLKRLWSTDEVLVLVNGENIEQLLESRLSVDEWLEILISASLK